MLIAKTSSAAPCLSMEASPSLSKSSIPPIFQPNTDKIKRKLLKHGIHPTPKIIHTLVKKSIQKHNRKLNKFSKQSAALTPRISEEEDQILEEDSEFLALKQEFREFNKALKSERLDFGGVPPKVEPEGQVLDEESRFPMIERQKRALGESKEANDARNEMVGLPWEGIDRVRMKEIFCGKDEFKLEKKMEGLRELGEMFEERRVEELKWLLDEGDLELECLNSAQKDGLNWSEGRRKRPRTEDDNVRILVTRLGAKEIDRRDWKFAKMMKFSGLQFTEKQMLKILRGLGHNGNWKQALSVVEWVYDDKVRRDWKSRFVYTKLLAVLGNVRRPLEALRIFNLMREDFYLYPDMAAYHSIAVTLGQSGLLRELIKLIECMKQKPSRKIKHLQSKNWDPVLEPDLVVFNAVLNACVPSQQWKGVFWVFQELRKSGLKPTAASYGLAMEVMLRSGKYDLVHEFFKKMKRSGEVPKAITYKILVKCFWEEGRINEAVKVVREMEQRGVVGTAAVYYELACCLCNSGRWREAMSEIQKLRQLHHAKPLEVTFTGMIVSAMEGGHIDDCLSIFNCMRGLCTANIGTINTMLRVYLRNDMFSKAKELFEELKGATRLGSTTAGRDDSSLLIPDEYTYAAMLEVSAAALQWEYFEYVYKEMLLSGYRLNQSKHASLLVAACRAGKGYLLEHAFDAVIDAGEVPCPIIFLEMVIQAVIQYNFETAVSLICAMSLASFQVSERQWTELFAENHEKIGKECLENLLEALSKCEIKEEATVTNVLRSLRSLCELKTVMGTNNHEVRAKLVLKGSNTEGSDPVQMCPDNTLVTSETGSLDLDCENCGSLTNFDNILASFNSDGSLKEFPEGEPDLHFSGFGNPGHDVPSAKEVLESWKQSRLKEGGRLFPFQVGLKNG